MTVEKESNDLTIGVNAEIKTVKHKFTHLIFSKEYNKKNFLIV